MSDAEISATNTATHSADTPQLLLDHHLKELRLPTILREYDKVARQCAVEQVDYQHYLLRITELELLDRESRATERLLFRPLSDLERHYCDSFFHELLTQEIK
jgi:hypothetical protein